MRLERKRSQTMAGRYAFMAQVSGSLPVEPNFIPAIETMLEASGSEDTKSRSSKSPRIVRMPWLSRAARAAGIAEAAHADDHAARPGQLRGADGHAG